MSFENYDPKTEAEKIRAEMEAENKLWRKQQEEAIRIQAERDWNVSEIRWERFRNSVITVAVIAVVGAILVWMGGGIAAWWGESGRRSDERVAWGVQCRDEGGKSILVDDDLGDYYICVVDGKVVRTRSP